MGQPEQALAEYEAKVKLSPSRFNSLYGAGQNAEMAKHRDQGGRLLRATSEALRRGNSTRPEIAHGQAFVSTVAKQKLIFRLGSRARATQGSDAMAQLRDLTDPRACSWQRFSRARSLAIRS
jgi:hypothetical protein